MERIKHRMLWAETDPVSHKFLFAGFFLLLLWLMAIVVAPVLVAAPYKALNLLGSAIYFFMDPVCHQLPDRSLFISGLPMPVCARCFAIYLTGTVVIGFAIMKKAFYLWPARWYIVLTLLAAVLILPEKAGWMADYVEIRMLAGVLLGVLIFRLILEAIVYGKKGK